MMPSTIPRARGGIFQNHASQECVVQSRAMLITVQAEVTVKHMRLDEVGAEETKTDKEWARRV